MIFRIQYDTKSIRSVALFSYTYNCALIAHCLGKSTLLSALSGRLVPIDGLRTEGDGLELGVFTQDLAQDLVSTISRECGR